MTTNVLLLDVPSFDELLNIVAPTMAEINKQLLIFSGYPLRYAICPLAIILKTRNPQELHLNKLELLSWRQVFCSRDRR
jgi:hypothetical protein